MIAGGSTCRWEASSLASAGAGRNTHRWCGLVSIRSFDGSVDVAAPGIFGRSVSHLGLQHQLSVEAREVASLLRSTPCNSFERNVGERVRIELATSPVVRSRVLRTMVVMTGVSQEVEREEEGWCSREACP